MRVGPFVPPVVWMGVIFWLSTRSFAAEETGGWILPLLKALFPWATLPQLEFIHWLGRKTAHVLEYAVLAGLWHRAFSRGGGTARPCWPPPAAARRCSWPRGDGGARPRGSRARSSGSPRWAARSCWQSCSSLERQFAGSLSACRSRGSA